MQVVYAADRALAKQGQLERCVVGGCCELSTSVHHLVDRLGVELGYRMSEDTGYDVEGGLHYVRNQGA